MRCPECASEEVFVGHSEWICKNCGLVLEDSLLQAPYEETRAEAQMPNVAQAGTQTMAGKVVRKEWLYSHKEKKQLNLSKELDMLGAKLNVSKVVLQDAKELARKMQSKDGLVGRNPKAVLVASLYVSSLLHGVPRTHLDIELATGVNRYQVLKYQKILCETLGIKFIRVDIADLIQTYASKLGIPPMYAYKALELWDKIKDVPAIQSRPAYIIASALLYKVCQGEVTQAQVAFTSGVHEGTMRRFLKML